jgi:hypothetical protein
VVKEELLMKNTRQREKKTGGEGKPERNESAREAESYYY